MEKNNFIQSKKIIIILIILFMGLITMTGTYAFFNWNSTENTPLTMTIGKFADVLFTSGNDITTSLTPVYNYYDGECTTFSINNRSTISLSYVVKLNIETIDSELISSDIKYTLVKNNTVVASNNLGSASNGISIDVYSGAITNTTDSFEFYLWIDGNVENDLDMIGKTITGNIMVEQSTAVSLTTYISNLYNNTEKTVITNNEILYNQSRAVSLMNDRLGGTTVDYNDGNIRYYGANPSNYIDIGDTELDSDGNEITTLYRIIGLFKDMTVVNDDGTTEIKDLVKVIRNDSIGSYSWDNKSSGIGTSTSSYGSNNWADARLMMLLNPGYDKYNESNPLTDDSGDIVYGYEGSLYWNSKSGTCYTGGQSDTVNSSCDFKTNEIGLSSEAQEKIVSVVWSLRGWDTVYVYSNEAYNEERNGNVYDTTRATEWAGKIALMYPSDYGYATDLSSSVCSAELAYYNNSVNSYGCRSNDWLYGGSAIIQWTLSPYSLLDRRVFWLFPLGSLYLDGLYVNSAQTIRPVFYLDSELLILGGTGTSNDPYVIG